MKLYICLHLPIVNKVISHFEYKKMALPLLLCGKTASTRIDMNMIAIEIMAIVTLAGRFCAQNLGSIALTLYYIGKVPI